MTLNEPPPLEDPADREDKEVAVEDEDDDVEEKDYCLAELPLAQRLLLIQFWNLS